MYPRSDDPIDSWNSVAVILRDQFKDPRLNGNTLLLKLYDMWKKVLHKVGALRSSDDNWIYISEKLQKENRGMKETDYNSPNLFLESLKNGNLYPGEMDFIILLNNTSASFNIAFVRAVSEFEHNLNNLDVRIKVVGSKQTGWKTATYGMLMEYKSEDERPSTYSSLIGVKKQTGLKDRTEFKAGIHLSSRIYKELERASGDITSIKSGDKWSDVKGVGWENKYFTK